MSNRSDDGIEPLRAELDRYPADRYPVQHATARFHLGVALLDQDRTSQALDSLVEAARLFEPSELPTEHAKAVNMAGIALRTLGRDVEAAGAFAIAARIFDEQGEHEECGATLFNLGVIERNVDETEAAVELLEAAMRLFVRVERPTQAAAAGRELAATLLERDQAEEAEPVATRAVELALGAGDHATIGSSENVRGLTLLALGRNDEAVEALRSAAGAHPRTVRPEGHAMAKANLALAYEQIGDLPRARIAARQALAVPDVPARITEQATAILDRVPDEEGDLLHVLDDEPPGAWPGVVGEELVRWATSDAATRRRECAALLAGIADAGDPAGLGEVWLGALLELPPQPMERLVASFIEAAAQEPESIRSDVRAAVSSGMVRFHGPQWMRLKETFNRIADELGQPADWG